MRLSCLIFFSGDAVPSDFAAPGSSRNPGSKLSTRSMLKLCMPNSRLGSTTDIFVSMISDLAFSVRIAVRTFALVTSLTRSVLFKRILSANASCRWVSFMEPSSFTSPRCCMTYCASTTVTTPSISTWDEMSWSRKNVWITGEGSAIPVVSIRMQSNSSLRSIRRLTTGIRSPRTLQQMQPLIISMISVLVSSFIVTRSASMSTAPYSFSMMANFMP
mmetsp:Transcript_36566/g.85480  ORF Transcript_36566/g.85480 Transcript_36566/m.85480 type:complete len:217 (+) Transcript_36566:574-1224(+)